MIAECRRKALLGYGESWTEREGCSAVARLRCHLTARPDACTVEEEDEGNCGGREARGVRKASSDVCDLTRTHSAALRPR